MEFIDWQLSSMSILFITGVFWGLLFDLHNYAKTKSSRVKKAGGIRDFFFWVCSFFLIAPLIFVANWLELRLYVWFSIGMGLIAYYYLFHPSLVSVFRYKG
ncbi:MAG TPA: spore cortex biosynthesis protein YabQ [Bacillota bacterium]